MTSDRPPLVLLDLDGTLVDSAPGITACVAHAFGALGLPVPDAVTLRSFVGPPITTSFAAHGVPAQLMPDAVRLYREAYRAGGMDQVAVFPGIPDALVRLRAAGCRLGVATSKPTVFARPICERLGLAALLDDVHGAPLDEHLSTKAMVVAEALEAAAAHADLTRAVMVGDREHDVHGAAEHGLPCLGVTWGYAGPGELVAAGAAGLVEQVDELAEAVLRMLVVAPAE